MREHAQVIAPRRLASVRGHPMRPIAFLCSITLVVMLLSACSGGGSQPAATRTPIATPAAEAPVSARQATLHGTLTLDGAPIDAQFLGAHVVRDGLETACQGDIPAVAQGRYELPVASDAEVRGCGVPGATIVLWVYRDDGYFYTTEGVPWPGDGQPAEFNGAFASSVRDGASKPATELKGHLFDKDGTEFPPGTVLEAFVGPTRCAVTSLRYDRTTEGYYTLLVVGPESVPGCTKGATINFTIDGKPAAETAVNDLDSGGTAGGELDLTVQ